MKDLINTKEAAKILGVSPKTLEKWRERKLFGVPFFPADEMHGGTWYYDRERVEQLKSVYQKGLLQNMYKLADAFESLPSPDFQKSPTRLDCFASGFYTTESLAKILGVSESTLGRWRNKKILVEDFQSHLGIYFYNQDRVLEMKMLLQKDSVTTPSFANVLADDDPIATIKRLNGSLRPSRIRTEINEKLAKVVFKLSDGGMTKLLNGDTFEIIEKHNHKKNGDIITTYKILNAAGYNIQRPFTLLDRFVLAVCISEWLEGNRYTTPAIIYRALTGKVDRGRDAKPSKDQLAAIIDSIKILMCRNIDYAAKDLCEVLGYNDGKPFSGIGPLLPAAYFDASAENGLDAITIFFLSEPPLLKMAQNKGQIISYDSNLLDIPRQQNTPMNIELKNYCMLRVQEVLAHRQLTPTITFNDVFTKARMKNAHVETKRRAREFIKAFFEHLMNQHIIDSFEVTNKHGAFYSIKFTHSKQ